MSLKSKSNWILPEKITVDSVIEYLLSQRGIEDMNSFLMPTLESIPDFNSMYDAKSAAKEIVKAVKGDKKIVIHGDFDADGICSVSILWEFLYREVAKYLDKEIVVVPYIPSRVDQGYGLTESSLKDIVELGADLLISVDCGVRDKELIKKVREESNLQFVITDHHQPPDDILDELDYTLVHPMYPSHEYPTQSVCGAYVAFLLTQAIRAELGMEHEIKGNSQGLDLVALATVTDIMPLTSVNRVVVKYGIEQMNKGTRLGLKQLCSVAGIQLNSIDSYHLGYILGPRINAAGRIGSPLEAVKLLVSDKAEVCKRIAEELNETNFQRQYMTQNSLAEAESLIQSFDSKILVVLGENWHEGIVGLVAGKLNEKYNRPVLVATKSTEGIRGSARSIPGFHITEILEECSEYLDRFGGHEQAAGFTVKADKYDQFKNCIEQIAEERISNEMLVKDLNIDLHISTTDVNYPLLQSLDRLKPFGFGNSKPTVAITNLVVFKKQIMGKLGNHMKLICKGDGVDLVTLILFGCDEDTETLNSDDTIDVVGEISINSWNGNEDIQFLVREWRYSTN